MAKGVRHGYTTGACAAAAAKGAALLLQGQTLVEAVTIDLPAGERVTFALHGQTFDAGQASCFVIKDAGDDPDVTNGCEVWARVQRSSPNSLPPFRPQRVLQGEGRGGDGQIRQVPHGNFFVLLRCLNNQIKQHRQFSDA